MPEYKETSEDFEFDAGATLLVRIRKNGSMAAKFVAGVEGFRHRHTTLSDQVVLNVPWDDSPIGTVKLNSYDAEFEEVDSLDEVNF